MDISDIENARRMDDCGAACAAGWAHCFDANPERKRQSDRQEYAMNEERDHSTDSNSGPMPIPESSGEMPALQLRITVIGVGNAGGNAVERMARNGFGSVRLIAVSTHAQVLGRTGVPEKLVLASRLRHGLGTGGDPEQGRAAAEADREVLRGLCEGADIIFVVAGLGGGTGSGAAPVIAQMAKETGALVLGVVMLPFDWEGTRRRCQAQESLLWLQAKADSVICISNQRLFTLIDETTSVAGTFDIINSFVEEGVRSIWRLLTQPSLIPVDFADLCAVTRSRHAQSSLAAAEASGANRARDLIEQLLHHPLLDDGRALTQADALLVSLVGGPGLTMTEVGRVMDQIRRQAENANLIIGTAIDEEMGDRLHATVIATEVQSAPPGGQRALAGTDPCARSAVEGVQAMESHPAAAAESRAGASRFAARASQLTPEEQERLFSRQRDMRAGEMKKSRWQQSLLPLEIVSKGRFEKSEPTIHRGEDLDVPTYIRRGIALN
jgi:cell division protein FtsZ